MTFPEKTRTGTASAETADAGTAFAGTTPTEAASARPAFAEKLIWTRPVIETGGRRVKRYHVAADRAALTPAVEEAAYAILPRLLPEPDGTPPATFVVLHRGGDSGAYLNAYSWAWDNVLYFGGAAAGQPVLGCPDEDPAHFVVLDRSLIGCVWELPPLLHERDAWVRHMLAPHPPTAADLDARLDAYLADVLPAGTTGDRP